MDGVLKCIAVVVVGVVWIGHAACRNQRPFTNGQFGSHMIVVE